MSDSISRNPAIDGLNKFFPSDPMKDDYTQGITVGLALAIEYIKQLPPAQPKIVRCKDCKWKQGSECVRFADVRPFPDDFCSRAERR